MKHNKEERDAMAAQAIYLMGAAKECDNQASKERERIAKTYGAGQFPNRYPITGGLCEHWPEEEKKIIRQYNTFKSEMIDQSFDLWKKAGRRSHTWRAIFHSSTN